MLMVWFLGGRRCWGLAIDLAVSAVHDGTGLTEMFLLGVVLAGLLRFGLYSDRPGCLSPCLCGPRVVWGRAGYALLEADASLVSRPVGLVLCLGVCFKQVQGACTLDVSLMLVCSGLQLVRGFVPSRPLLAVD